jgi:hypothetical protein
MYTYVKILNVEKALQIATFKSQRWGRCRRASLQASGEVFHGAVIERSYTYPTYGLSAYKAGASVLR